MRHLYQQAFLMIFCVAAWALICACITMPENNGSAVKDVLGKINGEPVIPRRANKIYIQDFSDFAGDLSVAQKTTIRVRDFIIQDGRLSVVSLIDNADVALFGKIVQYELQPIEYGEYRQPVKKRVRIIATVKLYSRLSGSVIFDESPVQSFETFSDTVPPIVSEYQVKERVIEALAQRIVKKTLSGWYTELMTPVEKGFR